MNPKVLLLTPPFTQLNTPYPATAYLKGFLNTKNIPSFQADLGLDVILELFSKKGLIDLFDKITKNHTQLSENSQRILHLRNEYILTIDGVISYLHDTNPTIAYKIVTRKFLPEASRFEQIEDLDWAFGSLGIRDRARHIATLYLEDISDFIIDAIDPHFGFSRYAERLGRSASTFNAIHSALQLKDTYIDQLMLQYLSEYITDFQPDLVALSVPFPGNLYSAFKCGQWIKKNYPTIKIALGGGYANTELRSLCDERVFNFLDYITLDDGEAPLLALIESIAENDASPKLKRTFQFVQSKVTYCNTSEIKDFKQKDCGTPDYSDLKLNAYLSVIELANPMHRLWSDGRWNKLTLAHGCYWGKCTFCDISLDYIKTYEAASAIIIVDRIEQLIHETGNSGFHFVDEAAPPALMREVALELLRRDLKIVWWTNIRFEKSFTSDLCRLLAYSGCIAVSGGLEVASDRLLHLIEKGVTVEQVAQVTSNLTTSGIMVHAYLMYGFPSQTEQETIDSLEYVRQLFESEIIQSGFWHQFALTVHSPVGKNPEKFGITITSNLNNPFANNDLDYKDPFGCDSTKFSQGLKKSLFNFMHGIGFELPLQEWFDFKIPVTTVPKNAINKFVESYSEINQLKPSSKFIWLGALPSIKKVEKIKKSKTSTTYHFQFSTLQHELKLKSTDLMGDWLEHLFPLIHFSSKKVQTYENLSIQFNEFTGKEFQHFTESQEFSVLRNIGLIVV